MLQGNEWNKFFDNIENKTDLLRLLTEYLKREDVSKTLRIPIIVNDKDNTRKISEDSQSMIFECNHEADSRMVLHNCLQDVVVVSNVVVVSKDTVVLVLMVFVFVYHQSNKEWFMKIEAGKYADIGSIVKHFGDEFCLKHALTGCDTRLGESTDVSNALKDRVPKFIQVTGYNGLDDDSFVDARVRQYKKMKTKSSLTFPPDPNSMKQHILRANYQLKEWLRFGEKVQEMGSVTNSGWIWMRIVINMFQNGLKANTPKFYFYLVSAAEQ